MAPSPTTHGEQSSWAPTPEREPGDLPGGGRGHCLVLLSQEVPSCPGETAFPRLSSLPRDMGWGTSKKWNLQCATHQVYCLDGLPL